MHWWTSIVSHSFAKDIMSTAWKQSLLSCTNRLHGALSNLRSSAITLNGAVLDARRFLEDNDFKKSFEYIPESEITKLREKRLEVARVEFLRVTNQLKEHLGVLKSRKSSMETEKRRQSSEFRQQVSEELDTLDREYEKKMKGLHEKQDAVKQELERTNAKLETARSTLEGKERTYAEMEIDGIDDDVVKGMSERAAEYKEQLENLDKALDDAETEVDGLSKDIESAKAEAESARERRKRSREESNAAEETEKAHLVQLVARYRKQVQLFGEQLDSLTSNERTLIEKAVAAKRRELQTLLDTSKGIENAVLVERSKRKAEVRTQLEQLLKYFCDDRHMVTSYMSIVDAVGDADASGISPEALKTKLSGGDLHESHVSTLMSFGVLVSGEDGNLKLCAE